MPRLRWRTYRTEEEAPVPVASAERDEYQLDRPADLPDLELPVEPFEEARVLDEGRRLGSGESLPASMLGGKPVLLAPTRGEGTDWVPARPKERPTRATAYSKPRFIGAREVLVPGRPEASDQELRLLEAESLRDGVFQVKPGLVGPTTGRVVNAGWVDVEYAPATGLVYVETEAGEPLPANSQFQLLVRAERTLRRPLEQKEQAITDPKTREVLAIARRQPRTVHDRRRLPSPSAETRWHALDQAHYDASPVSTDDLWVIETDAPSEDIRDAVRRTLPSGSLFRVEPYGAPAVPKRELGAGKLLLDVEPGALGYSLGRLRASHSGPVIQARRGTGDANPVEFRDFTAKQIDEGELGDWASGADGRAFLYRLYDQSGNDRDVQEPALEEQPLLAENGSVVTVEGRPVAQQRGGGFFRSLPDGEDFTVAIVGGAEDFSGDPALAEIDTGDRAETRFVVIGKDGDWRFTEQKFLGTDIVYASGKTGEIGTHVIKMKDLNVWASFDADIVNAEANQTATHSGLHILNDATGNKQGGFFRSVVAYSRVVDIDTRDRLLRLFQSA